MINNLINVLNEKSEIYGWKIEDTMCESEEVFFEMRKIGMIRTKSVRYLDITVYVLHSEKKTIGFSTKRLNLNLTIEELKERISDLVDTANLCRCKYFELVKKQKGIKRIIKQPINIGSNSIALLIKKIMTLGNVKNYINVGEIYLNRYSKRILNSYNVDCNYEYITIVMEINTHSMEKKHVELTKTYQFDILNDFEIPLLKKIKKQLEETRFKSMADIMPSLSNINIIIKDEDVKKIFEYFIKKTNSQMIYEGLSNSKVGDYIQNQNINSDKITVTLEPYLNWSVNNIPIDGDGVILKRYCIIDKGRIVKIHGDNQYASYLGIKPSGMMEKFSVLGGDTSYENMKKEPYVEIISFSDLNIDILTGNISGEIRLAETIGEKNRYYYGGVISTNIMKIFENVILSSELIEMNGYKGPKAILFNGCIIS